MRAARAKPIVNAIGEHAAQICALAERPIDRTAKYLENQWVGLTRFVRDPRIPITSNAAEGALRALVLGRNYHFGSESNAEPRWRPYNLIESARLNCLKPARYLKFAAEVHLRGGTAPPPARAPPQRLCYGTGRAAARCPGCRRLDPAHPPPAYLKWPAWAQTRPGEYLPRVIWVGPLAELRKARPTDKLIAQLESMASPRPAVSRVIVRVGRPWPKGDYGCWSAVCPRFLTADRDNWQRSEALSPQFLNTWGCVRPIPKVEVASSSGRSLRVRGPGGRHLH